MAKINWTDESLAWLRDIHEYIAKDNPVAATNVVEGIYGKAQLLQEYVEIGYKYRDTDEGDIRILLYGHYRIAYLIKNDNEVDILGIFHGALDIDRYIL